MQISSTLSAPSYIQHQGPSGVQSRLEGLVDQLDDLATRLRRETSIGYHVSREWPVQVRSAATQLRFAADAVSRLGGAQEAILGQALLADSTSVAAFADELATAYAAHDRFGSPRTADWTERLAQPAAHAAAALALIERSPARP